MSNVKVKFSLLINTLQLSYVECVFSTDILPHSIRNDICYCPSCVGHYVLPKTKRIITQALVMALHSKIYGFCTKQKNEKKTSIKSTFPTEGTASSLKLDLNRLNK